MVPKAIHNTHGSNNNTKSINTTTTSQCPETSVPQDDEMVRDKIFIGIQDSRLLEKIKMDPERKLEK